MELNEEEFALSEEGQELIRQAREAYKYAYVPYSHYPVGAAALFLSGEKEDVPGKGGRLAGKIYRGCNVENASYGLTICAERNAIFQAASRGGRILAGIAIAVPGEGFPAPCGACRQVMREFAEDCPVLLINGRGEIKTSSLKKLLPDSFGPESL